MSFARRDLLQRHYTVHGRDQNQDPIPAANGMIPKSAGRTPIACSNCAKTKTKCDKKFPCSRCAGRNLRCTLRPTRRSTKNAQRMGVPPEGAVAIPPYTDQLGPQGVMGEQAPTTSPPQQQQILKPASPKEGMATISKDDMPPPLNLPVVDGPPPQVFEHPTSGPTPVLNDMSPPMQTPSAFVHQTPVASFDLREESEQSSPRFMLDWSQMHMPIAFDGMVQPSMIMQQGMPYETGVIPVGANGEPLLPIMSDGTGPLITPIESPKLDRSFHDLKVGSSATSYHPQRSMSVVSTPERFEEVSAIVAAQDAWTAFRCTPTIPSASCPKTARLNLELLESTLRNHEGWSTWSPQWEEADFAGADHLTVMQLHESTRDKLLAITQSFLHKALETHRDTSSRHTPPDSHSPGSHSATNFVLLPPARVLEFFLRSYTNSFERYYPLTSRGILDANELMHCYNDRAASLLVLMMMAQGAMNIPSKEARLLTGGLNEACRISLFDLIERNVIMSGDAIVMHSALLFIVQAAWSGDKWQMDIAMGQRGMYFAMLRHSGSLDYRSQQQQQAPEQRPNTDQLWSDWIHNESKSRLVYSWVMVDQDISLFHDTQPLFSVTEFAAPLPDADRLWHAKSAGEWSAIFEQVHEFSGGYSSVGSGARPLSLRDLFRHFLDDEMVSMGIEMTPLQMRLLLHPLQSLVCQYSQLLSCFSDSASKRSASPRSMTASSTRTRLEEVQSLLGRWFDLAERYLKANPVCPMMQTNLVIFHLISLNAVTNLPEIERLARRENIDGTYQQLVWMHKRCIADVEEAVFHCGQVFRLIRSMPRGIRPPWWAAAIYRVGLILWTDSLLRKDNLTPNSNGIFPVAGPTFAIDALPADHPLIVRYLTKREGVPCVSKHDGSQMPIDQAYPMLQHCIEVIDEGAASRFSDGIRNKLDRLSRG
ncbi:hypothetical protein LTR78_002996 [Recurvomyces mirabilis]|uniref:Zn(2)-C6 fungal-type domain-containing protein n=1 Tax=Recurvomyces mirabilis TaxID=574656 RepID=A0AAE0WT04_9PEZI|nr:hypothetical protein LTR78_002996 [Recurvomyces mirabilis]KAK5159273.1 hypothetical protein LTS14_002415 [Recurvomyces mirabilis]